MSDRGHSPGYLPGLVTGILLGAGLYYFLTTTEEGKKVKKELKEKGKVALNNLAEVVSDFETKGEEFRKQAQKLQAELEEKARDVREDVAEEAKTKLAHIEQLRERGRVATKRFFIRNGKRLT